MSAIGLRPYVAADGKRCLEIFVRSVAELTSDDYDEDQRDAWIAAADDEKAFAKRLAAMLTLIATIDGAAAGFASLEGADCVEMLYVDPDYARRGVATALLGALTRLAAARGAKRLTADVSDTAKPLFDRQGFVAERRNLVTRGDQWLANTTMSKSLAGNPAANDATTRH